MESREETKEEESQKVNETSEVSREEETCLERSEGRRNGEDPHQ